MQGVRQANVTFGETVAVIGVRPGRRSGNSGLACRGLPGGGHRSLSVTGCKSATSLGAHLGLCHERSGIDTCGLLALRSGCGTDCCRYQIGRPPGIGGELLRDRGRISVIGDVGMESVPSGYVQQRDHAGDVSLLRSGRYDPHYEEGGRIIPSVLFAGRRSGTWRHSWIYCPPVRSR